LEILVTICARSGSKGIPDKNIRLINGIPLIGYSILLARQIQKKYNADIGLSTDSQKYKEIAQSFGLYTDYIRPKIMATDGAGKIDVIADLKRYEEEKRQKTYDFVIELEVTCPLRNLQDIEESLNQLIENKRAHIVVGVSPVTKNPYYNMWEKQENGFWNLSKKRTETIHTRQSAPEIYASNGMVYIMRPSFFENGYKSIVTDKTDLYVAKHMCFDLDEMIDLHFMEYVISNNKLDFDMGLNNDKNE